VLAEPAATHGLDPVWRLNYVLFSQTKLWVYRILAALVSLFRFGEKNYKYDLLTMFNSMKTIGLN
jgi:hypothetical protein